jgi:excisionase family DNA binding protein
VPATAIPHVRLTITVEEAAELLGISRGHAYQMAREGSIPCIRLGRRFVVVRHRLLAMLDGETDEQTAA